MAQPRAGIAKGLIMQGNLAKPNKKAAPDGRRLQL
jgi:hypothetical protein